LDKTPNDPIAWGNGDFVELRALFKGLYIKDTWVKIE
jgi:hypothetical protein